MQELLERQQHETPEAIASSLEGARREVVEMTGDLAFHEVCLGQDPSIDPFDDMETPAYWDTFADYAAGKIEQEAGEQGGMNLELDTKQLLAETPRFLFTDVALAHSSDAMDKKEYGYSREVVSYYNDLLRGFAYDHPETNVADIEKGVLEMLQKASIEDEMLQEAGDSIDGRLRGAQHELSFGQVLPLVQQYLEANTGDKLTFYPATREQDLRGIDWTLQLQRAGSRTYTELRVDVKASDAKLRTTGQMDPELPFSTVHPGEIMVHLPFSQDDFGGKFFVNERAALRQVLTVVNIIRRAIQ